MEKSIACPLFLSCGAANIGGSRPFKAALREQQSSLRLRNRTPKLFSRLDPLLDHDLDIGNRLLSGRPVGGASGEFRDFSDERLIFVAPVENNFVFCHLAPSASLVSMRELRDPPIRSI